MKSNLFLLLSIYFTQTYCKSNVITIYNTRQKNVSLKLRGGNNPRYFSNINKENQRYQPFSKQQKQSFPIVEELPSNTNTETSTEVINAFLTRNDRTTFIARVYSILTVQLIITTLFIFFFHSLPKLSFWMLTKGRIVPFLSLLMSSISCTILMNSVEARRKSPIKWQLLAMFTVGEAISVGCIASLYPLITVLSAMCSTALATGGVTLYTMYQTNPKYDLSQWGAGLSSFGLVFLFYGMLHVLTLFGIIPKNLIPYNESMYCIIGATLFSFYLAYHTRLIVAGKSKYQMNEKDYVFGAVALYSDIINMFIYILRILGSERDER